MIKNSRFRFVARTVLFTIALLFMFNSLHAQTIEIGKAAPDFELSDQNGQPHSLQKYRGSWVVLYFYPKDDTPGCTKEACAFRDDYRAISAKNTQVLGVSVDSQESHADFANKYNLPFPLLVDTKGKVAEQYQSLTSLGPIKLAKRHTYIIGPDGLVQMIYKKVDPNHHSQEILDQLGKLQNKKM